MMYIYRIFWIILGPIVDIWFLYRYLSGKEDKARIKERLGIASISRPNGKLIWIHGASVGETKSVLPLINKLLDENPFLHILLTSGTKTSATLMAKELPERAFHQYIPLDFWGSIKIFLDYWKPDISIFVESEFWPEMLYQAPNPILINARISDRSFKKYKRFSFFFKPLLKRFRICLAQTEVDASRLAELGANATTAGNLKFDAPPLTVNTENIKLFKNLLGDREVIVISSTHDPEEEWLATLHLKLKQNITNLLTIIVPRHPERGVKIAEKLQNMGINIKCRSRDELPDNNTAIYLADSMGEMGLWYNLAGIVIIGGSLIPHGGQNPLEPIKLGKVTICGPHMHNFTHMTDILTKQKILTQINSLVDLENKLYEILSNDKKQKDITIKSTKIIKQMGGATAKALHLVNSLLNK